MISNKLLKAAESILGHYTYFKVRWSENKLEYYTLDHVFEAVEPPFLSSLLILQNCLQYHEKNVNYFSTAPSSTPSETPWTRFKPGTPNFDKPNG